MGDGVMAVGLTENVGLFLHLVDVYTHSLSSGGFLAFLSPVFPQCTGQLGMTVVSDPSPVSIIMLSSFFCAKAQTGQYVSF